jgi:hypothetical protein
MHFILETLSLKCLKKLTAIFLLFVLMLQYFNKVEIFVYYQLNKGFISSTFCENKSKPELRCDGKCYMKKQLKATDENQSKTPINIRDFQEIIFFCSHSEILLTKQNTLPDLRFANLKNTNYPSPYFSIFQPPKAA